MRRTRWMSVLAAVALVVFVGATSAQAAAPTVVGSKHDLRTIATVATANLTEVCVACHTPHQATGAPPAGAGAQPPLWNHEYTTTASFGVYTSPTLNAVPGEIGNVAAPGKSVSQLCMSCHDGTVSVLSMYNPPNSAAGAITTAGFAGRILANGRLDPVNPANLGASLVDDHPVNFTYNTLLATNDGGLVDPAASPTITSWLVGGTLQCSSCHNPHDNSNGSFLQISNTGSALCITCHTK